VIEIQIAAKLSEIKKGTEPCSLNKMKVFNFPHQLCNSRIEAFCKITLINDYRSSTKHLTIPFHDSTDSFPPPEQFSFPQLLLTSFFSMPW
jgi:hypothetical protein